MVGSEAPVLMAREAEAEPEPMRFVPLSEVRRDAVEPPRQG